MMKKLILSLLFIALLAVFVGSFVTGPVTRSVIEEQVARINEIPGYRAELVSYDSGWRNASGKILVGLDLGMFAAAYGTELTEEQAAEIDSLPAELLFDLQVAHGPIRFEHGLIFGLSAIEIQPDVSALQALQSFQQQVGIDALFTLTYKIGLLGNTRYRADFPAWEATNGGEMAKFGGGMIEGVYQSLSSTLVMDGLIQPLSIISDDVELTMAATEVVADLEILNAAVQLGDMAIKMEGFSGSIVNAEPFSLENLLIEYSGERDGDETVKTTERYSIDKVSFNEHQLSDLNFTVVLEQASIDAMGEFYQLIMDSWGGAEADAGLQAEQMASLAELGREFLQHSPVIDITDMSFSSNLGRFSSHARVAFDGSGDVDLNNPMALIQHVSVLSEMQADARLLENFAEGMLKNEIRDQALVYGEEMSEDEIDEIVTDQVQAFVNQQVEQGLLVRTVNGYKASFIMDKGSMELNGQPFSPFGMAP